MTCRQCKAPIIFPSQRVTINRPAADNDDRIEFDLCLNCWETLIYRGAMEMIR